MCGLAGVVLAVPRLRLVRKTSESPDFAQDSFEIVHQVMDGLCEETGQV
jgi:hypothetical protein